MKFKIKRSSSFNPSSSTSGSSLSLSEAAGRRLEASLRSLRPLLQVLQKASVAEVINVSTEEHQLGVDVVGHTVVVEGRGVAVGRRHHQGGHAVTHALPTAPRQGTKPAAETRQTVRRAETRLAPNVAPPPSYRQYCANVRT